MSHATLILLEIAWIVVIGAWVLLQKRPPVATLAWIFGLALLPGIGALLYFWWGPLRFGRRKRRIRRARSVIDLATRSRPALFDRERGNTEPLIRLATRLGGLPPMSATRVRLFSQGDDYFAAVEKAIASARHHVHLEFYIVRDDVLGLRLIDLLMAQARKGIEVRLLADPMGSRISGGVRRKMRQAGVKFEWFNPTAVARLRRRIVNFRTHRKILVVDGAIGFCGSTNVCSDHSFAVKAGRARRDTDVELEGEAVQGLQYTFLENWLFASGEPLRDRDLDEYFPGTRAGAQIVQIVPAGPDSEHRALYSFLLGAIGLARKRIWLIAPYFVPDEALLNALCVASARGTDVQIIVPAESDWRLVDAAGASTHDQLLGAGVRIHLFGPPLLHAKTAVIDDDLAIVGTANLDDRSMKLNFEVAAAFYGPPMPERLAALFGEFRAQATPKLDLEKDAPFARRLFQAGARLFSPQL
jgi:cardiolipin synthase